MLNSISNPRRAIAAATLAAIMAIGAHGPAAAEVQIQPPQMQLASVEVPAFLANTGATALTKTEMSEIQGEGVKSRLRKLAVRYVKKAAGNAAAAKLDAALRQTGLMGYSDYREHFGRKASVIYSAIPYWLRPQIAQ